MIGLANPDHGVLVAHDHGFAAGYELASAARASLLMRLHQNGAEASVVAGIGDPAVLADARLSALLDQADDSILATLETYLDLAGETAAAHADRRVASLWGRAALVAACWWSGEASGASASPACWADAGPPSSALRTPCWTDHAVGFTTVLDALYLRNQLLRLLAAAAVEPDPELRSRDLPSCSWAAVTPGWRH